MGIGVRHHSMSVVLTRIILRISISDIKSSSKMIIVFCNVTSYIEKKQDWFLEQYSDDGAYLSCRFSQFYSLTGGRSKLSSRSKLVQSTKAEGKPVKEMHHAHLYNFLSCIFSNSQVFTSGYWFHCDVQESFQRHFCCPKKQALAFYSCHLFDQ